MGRNDKIRKQAVPTKSKLKKDPGVPRLPSLKAKHEQKERARQHRPSSRSPDGDCTMASEPTLSTLASLASAQLANENISEAESSSFAQAKTKEQARRHYVRTLHKVIDQSDIVVLVLDARDPEGCRSRLVEEEVRRREAEGKKLVFVLNKIDLVPRDNAQAWLRHLRHSTPTLPFRSATNAQRTNLSSSTAPALLRLLKAYKPSAIGSVTVGIVGYPNVGKSSLINSLKRSKVCAVAAQPGHTKDLQSVQLERGIKIVDSPGVVFDEDEEGGGAGTAKGNILLRNVVKVEDIDDPIAVVEEILTRTDHEILQKIYSLPQFSSTLEFLGMLALTTGRLLKGGTPDLMTSARHVLQDWNQQKIPYFSVPPAVHPSSVPEAVPAPGAEDVGRAQIVTEFSAPFQLAGLFGAADAGAFEDDAAMDDNEPTTVDAEFQMEDAVNPDEDGSRMVEEVAPISLPLKRSRSRSPSPITSSTVKEPPSYATRAPKRQRRAKDVPEYDAPVNAHAIARGNPMNRRMLKKDAKKARRAANKAALAEHSRSGGMDIDKEDLEFTFMA